MNEVSIDLSEEEQIKIISKLPTVKMIGSNMVSDSFSFLLVSPKNFEYSLREIEQNREDILKRIEAEAIRQSDNGGNVEEE